jgi:aminopeptidase
MADSRIKRLAKILTEYSVDIKKGDIISINSGVEAKSLVLEVAKLILKKGAIPRINLSLEEYPYIFFKHAKDEQLKRFPKITLYEVKNSDGFISIGTEYNTRELTNINPKKLAIKRRASKPVQDLIMKKKNWVICEYPTNALAQEADMSLNEFENFVFKATNRKWNEEEKKQIKLKKLMDKTDRVRIVGKDTDITFSIKDRPAKTCAGKFNMPDGEVFTSVVEDSTEGYIRYTYPVIKDGREVDDVQLWFSKGKVIKAKAKKNERFLKETLNTDKGSKTIGEFGVGFNYGIKKFIKNILFDEKIGGTIHLALGQGYEETLSKNKSAIHWDMIKDLRKGGEIYFDGKLIQKDGKFVVKL